MQNVYLDNSSTTPVCRKSIDNANYAFNNVWYNPSSLYEPGLMAEKLVSSARKSVADCLCCKESEVYFTSCGTEANNTAIFGAAAYLKKRGNRIVTSCVEHPSVLNPMKRLEEMGFEVIYLDVDSCGVVSEESLKNAINENTILVSLMAVNNETGAVMPIHKVKEIIKNNGSDALFHCDAVQAFMKTEINVKALGIDLLSLSGHKINAPKGIGALYKSENAHIKPYILGGGQENGFRSGTESVPLIYALQGAIESIGSIKENYGYVKDLNLYAKERLSTIDGIVFNSCNKAFPYIINIALPGFKSETLLHFLEAEGIYVSSGSACSKGKTSSVLAAMGVSSSIADSSLRISFSKDSKKEEIDLLTQALNNATSRLMRKNRR